MRDYTGIPFVSTGRSFKGADCYGIVELYYKHELGITINPLVNAADNFKRTYITFLKEIETSWEEIAQPVEGCVVAMCMSENHPRMVTHFGVMLTDKKLLQTLEKTNSHIINIDDPRVKGSVAGFYKWRG